MAPILTPAQIADLKTQIAAAEVGKQICARGAACGFDLSGHEATLHALQQRLQQTLKQFGGTGISPS